MSLSCKVVELRSCGEASGISGRGSAEDGMTGSRCWDCFVSSVVGGSQGQCFRRSWKGSSLRPDDKEPMLGLLRRLRCRQLARTVLPTELEEVPSATE